MVNHISCLVIPPSTVTLFEAHDRHGCTYTHHGDSLLVRTIIDCPVSLWQLGSFLFPDSPTSAWFLTMDEKRKAVQRIKVRRLYHRLYWISHLIVCFQGKSIRCRKQTLQKGAVCIVHISIILSSITFRTGWSRLWPTRRRGYSHHMQLWTMFWIRSSINFRSSSHHSVLLRYRLHSLAAFLGWYKSYRFIPASQLCRVFRTAELGSQSYSLFHTFSACSWSTFCPGTTDLGCCFPFGCLVCTTFWATSTLKELLWPAIVATSYIIPLAWVSQTTAGHTKRITTNAIVLSGTCIGNAAGPFMWKAKYKPRCVKSRRNDLTRHWTFSRNHVPWMIFGICDVSCICLLFTIRVLLSRENKRRDAEPRNDAYDNVFLTKIDQDGKRVEMRISKVCVP